jgi:hypothetical protein
MSAISFFSGRAPLILGIVFVFVALGAIPAGLSMILEPDGSGLKMTTGLLKGSPFKSFLIPGIFLFTVNGILNIAAAILCFMKSRFAGYAGIILGLCLILWIIIQVFSVGLNHFLQPTYFIIGMIEIFLGWKIVSGLSKKFNHLIH